MVPANTFEMVITHLSIQWEANQKRWNDDVPQFAKLSRTFSELKIVITIQHQLTRQLLYIEITPPFWFKIQEIFPGRIANQVNIRVRLGNARVCLQDLQDSMEIFHVVLAKGR